MALSRIPGYSLLSDLDRQGIDLQFTTTGSTLAYMDFSNFRIGINTTTPQQALEVNGNVLVANGSIYTSGNVSYDIGTTANWFNNLYVANINATTLTGTIQSASQPNITSVGNLTSLNVDGNVTPTSNITSWLGIPTNWWETAYISNLYTTNVTGTIQTADQPYISNLGNINVESIAIGGNIVITGNTQSGIIHADEIYENNYRVLTSNTTFTIGGDFTGSGSYNGINLYLANSGATAGTYGAADDEYTDKIPKITVNEKGIITNIANVTLTQVANVTFTDTTISTTANLKLQPSNELVLSPVGGNISANNKIIGNVATPISSGDAVNKGYLDGLFGAAANNLISGDSLVSLLDTGTSANVNFILDGNVVANIAADYTNFYSNVNIGNLYIHNETISSTGNITLDPDQGIVEIASTVALGMPVGDTSQRPGTPNAGYVRFNTDSNDLEFFDGNTWITTNNDKMISSQVINPDGTSNSYYLADDAVPESLLVTINGTLQQPSVSYTTTGNIITFNEVPLTTDVVEIRQITSGIAAATSLSYGDTKVILSTGNVNVTGNIRIAGNIVPTANSVYNLGSESLWWKDLYLSGSSIYLGNITLKNEGGILKVFKGNTATPTTLQADDPVNPQDVVTLNYLQTQLSSIDATTIQADNTSIQIIDNGVSAGNIVIAVDGSNVAKVGGDQVDLYRNVAITGNISANVFTYANGQSILDNVTSQIVTANTAMKGYVDGQITSLINGAPGTLDTLNEIANALGSDANLSVTLTNYISNVNANISTTNTAMKGYVDGQVTSVTTAWQANAGAQADQIVTSNTAMKGYVDAVTTAWQANAGAQAGSIIDLYSIKANLASPVFTGDVTTNSKYYGDGSQLTGTFDNNSLATSLAGGGTYANTSNWTTSTIWQGSTLTLYPDMSVDMNLITALNQVATGTRITVVDAVEGTFTTTLTAKPTNPGSTWVIPVQESAPTDRTNITSISFLPYNGNLNAGTTTISGNVTVSGNVKFTGWHIYESGTNLYFAYNGAVKMSLNTSGNLTVSGDVAGFGTP